ncbi:MAG: hypothetical protein IT350_03015 [Deltaproteobacteria bacterium]|nr:hypothetical protein [Deltaproteobacteria bacterium]
MEPNWHSDHALLSYVIHVVDRLRSRQGEGEPPAYLGRTKIQKIVYFLSLIGVPNTYRFLLHRFGPYSTEIQDDLDRLVSFEILLDESGDGRRYYDYRSTNQSNELWRSFRVQIEPFQDRIDPFVEALAKLSDDDLEVVSTLVYAYRWLVGAGNHEPSKTQILAKFQTYKKDKFPPDRVESAYEVLAKAGFLPSETSAS